MDDVVTGEAVVLDVPVARFPSRMLAIAIDLAVQLSTLVILLVIVAATQAGGGLDDAAAAAIALSVTIGVIVGYPAVFETLSRGRSLGKLAFTAKNREIRALYRRHMAGNSLYRNMGNGQFLKMWPCKPGLKWGAGRGPPMPGTSTMSPGSVHGQLCRYISGHDARDVSSFFWRQVVAKSPQDATSSESYERGWNAINELIRSDVPWNGFERNVFYLNNQDGTFSEVSGVVGLDFIDDSRSF